MQRSRRMLTVTGTITMYGRYLSLVLLAAVMTQAQESGSRDKASGISFERLMNYLQLPDRNDSSDEMAVKLIERFGLSFRPTADELARMRNSSAEPTLMKTIESARMPTVRPAIQDAGLVILCKPVDCDVWVGDRSIGHTSGGVSPWVTVNPGKIRVRAESTNYEAQQDPIDVVVAAGERREVPFTFQPSQSFLGDLGGRYFAQMVEALGEIKADDTAVRATGSLYVRDEAGVAAWSIIAWVDAAGLSRVDAARLRQKHTFTKMPSGSWRDSVARPSHQLADAITLLDSALLVRRLESLMKAGSELAYAPDEPLHRFRAKAGDGDYVVTLDVLSRPGKIERDPKDDSQGITYLYSGYSEIAGSSWPTNIDVIRSGSQAGISARFSSIEQTTMPSHVAGRRFR